MTTTLRRGDVFVAVDYRESDTRNEGLLNHLRALGAGHKNVFVASANLHVGDVIICTVVEREDESEQRDVTERTTADAVSLQTSVEIATTDRFDDVAIYERKTIGDFVSSVTAQNDTVQRNHWADQVTRIQNFCAATGARPFLMLEKLHGTDLSWTEHMSEKGVYTKLGRTLFADGFGIYQCESTSDTARAVWSHALFAFDERVTARGWTRFGRWSQREAFVVRKADRDTARSWLIGTLIMVPRMTEPAARAITDVYPTVRQLMDAYADAGSDTQRVKLLEDIRCNNRRLGPDLSKSVYQRFYGTPAATIDEPLKPRKRPRRLGSAPVGGKPVMPDSDAE